jgi:hypothetical protein
MHFGRPKSVAGVKRDLASRRGRWLHKAAKAILKATLKDWQSWRRGWKNCAK